MSFLVGDLESKYEIEISYLLGITNLARLNPEITVEA
jgi:hypothetical protein